MLYLGADHNGYFLKRRLVNYLKSRDLKHRDCGAFVLNKKDDYTDYASVVALKIKKKDFGILVCGSGHGMVIAANKFPGIRAIMPLDPSSARFGRHDDHANILVLASWQMNFDRAKKILAEFLRAKSGKAPRYLRRLKKIRALEK